MSYRKSLGRAFRNSTFETLQVERQGLAYLRPF